MSHPHEQAGNVYHNARTQSQASEPAEMKRFLDGTDRVLAPSSKERLVSGSDYPLSSVTPKLT